jgi:hypothetical protein
VRLLAARGDHGMTDEAYAERKSMLLLVGHWLKHAAMTGDAEGAMVGLLRQIDREERRKLNSIARPGKRIERSAA